MPTDSAFRCQSERGAMAWRSTSAGHGRARRSVSSEAAARRHAAPDGDAHPAAVGANDAAARRRHRAAPFGALTDLGAAAAVVPAVGAVDGYAAAKVRPRIRAPLIGNDRPVGVHAALRFD